MRHQIIQVILYPAEKKKLSEHLRCSGLKKIEFTKMIIGSMVKRFDKKANYTFKYSDFVRIRIKNFAVPVDNVSFNTLKALSENFNKSVPTIAREIFCTYLDNFEKVN